MLENLLTDLKMHAALAYFKNLGRDPVIDTHVLIGMFQEELAARRDRSKKMRLRLARFPVNKEWMEIDTSLNPKIDFKKIERHFDGEFVDEKRNLCLMGTPGSGKTHSLIALGRELCRQGKTVKFYTACELVNLLEEAKKELKLSRLMKKLRGPKLLIIDELGFIPFSENGARLLFDVFASRYERGSIAVSTNLSFNKWIQVLGAVELTAALVDRFTHNAHVFNFFEGRSIRHLQTTQGKSRD